MTRDELEFSISQYLDGTLAGADLAALETRLGSDPAARATLGEFERLNAALKAAPLPAVDWDRFADQICGAVAEQDAEPVPAYRIGFARRISGLALVAGLIVALGFGVRVLQQSQTTPPGGGLAVAPTKSATTIVVVDARSAAPAVSTLPVDVIAVGPSNALQDRPGFAGYHDDVVLRPSQVLIARSGQSVHDGAFLP